MKITVIYTIDDSLSKENKMDFIRTFLNVLQLSSIGPVSTEVHYPCLCGNCKVEEKIVEFKNGGFKLIQGDKN